MSDAPGGRPAGAAARTPDYRERLGQRIGPPKRRPRGVIAAHHPVCLTMAARPPLAQLSPQTGCVQPDSAQDCRKGLMLGSHALAPGCIHPRRRFEQLLQAQQPDQQVIDADERRPAAPGLQAGTCEQKWATGDSSGMREPSRQRARGDAVVSIVKGVRRLRQPPTRRQDGRITQLRRRAPGPRASLRRFDLRDRHQCGAADSARAERDVRAVSAGRDGGRAARCCLRAGRGPGPRSAAGRSTAQTRSAACGRRSSRSASSPSLRTPR